MIWADGRKYEGKWVENKRSGGKGKMTWPNGDV